MTGRPPERESRRTLRGRPGPAAHAASGGASGAGEITHTLPGGVTARYLRYYGTDRGTPWGHSFWTLSVWASLDPAPSPPPAPHPPTVKYMHLHEEIVRS